MRTRPHSHVSEVQRVVGRGDVVEEGPAGVGLVQIRVGMDVNVDMTGC